MRLSHKYLLLSTLCIVLVNAAWSQGGYEIYFSNEGHHEIPLLFVSDNNNGFTGIVTVYREPGGANNGIFNYIYHIDTYGDTSRALFPKQDTVYRILDILRVNTEPSGYLLVGYGYALANGTDEYLTFFLRLNEDLNVVWEKVFDFDFYYYGITATAMEENNGNLLYCCTPEGQYMFLLRLSPDGDSLQFRQYEGDESGVIYDITYNHDSSNILLHTDGAYHDPMTARCKIIKLDSNWNQIDVIDYPRDFLPNFTAKLLPNGNILNSGRILMGMGEEYITAYLLNEDLSIQHEFYLNNTDTTSTSASNISVDYYGANTYIGGTFDLYYHPNRERDPSWYYLAKVNDTLGIIFEKYIGGDAAYWLYSVAASSDGGILLAGTRENLTNDTAQIDGYLIKLDSNGCLTNLEANSNLQIKEALIYPNPGFDNLNIRTALKQCVFNMYDEAGKRVLTHDLTSRFTTLRVTGLKTGRYLYTINRGNKIVESGGWIKAHN